ncbi:MAG: hypothetical protein GX956_06005 [Firmicutes bacterium]|nr:hypothetical protein [Bacillota bacterium]
MRLAANKQRSQGPQSYHVLFTREVLLNPPARILAEHNHRRGDYDYPVLFTNKYWLRELVKNRAPGVYTLKDIFGLWWSIVRRPRHYGLFFYRLVERGEIPGIRYVGKSSNGSLKYEIT